MKEEFKKFYGKKGWIIRLSIIIIVTIYLNFFIFNSKQILITELALNNSSNNQSIISVPQKFNLSSEDSPNDIISVLWKVGYTKPNYKICFENNNSQIVLQGPFNNEVFRELMVDWQDQGIFEVKTKVCKNLPKELTQIEFTWRQPYNISVNPSMFDISNRSSIKIDAHFDAKAYLLPNFYAESIKFIVIFLSVSALYLLLTNIYHFIAYGSKHKILSN